MQPVYFQINDNDLVQFTRDIPKPKDCVINAMQLVNVVDKRHAELMRILVGDIGITLEQIEQIFNYLNKFSNTPSKWHYFFQKFDATNSSDVNYASLYIDSLTPGSVLFCGMTYSKGGERHVFILGRYLNGNYVIIDPQVGFSDMNSYLSQASEMFILSKIK